MTKKDYELIARQVLLTREVFAGTTIADEAWEILTGVSYQLAEGLENENPKFDRNKFLETCGTTQKSQAFIGSQSVDQIT